MGKIRLEVDGARLYNSNMIATKDILGHGIYSPQEAAFYARVPTQTINRWLFGDSKGERVIEPEFATSEDKVVTFLDFIQAMAIRAIRVQYKIPLPQIRKAVDKAKQEFGVDYPFATQHRTFLMSDQQKEGHGNLVIRLDSGDRLVQISGKSAGNLLLKEIAEPFLMDLHFDPVTGLADKYQPMKENGCYILFDPKQRFGEPLVMPCGYTAQTLFEAIASEGGISNAAKEYGISEDEVRLAYKFIDYLKTTSV